MISPSERFFGSSIRMVEIFKILHYEKNPKKGYLVFDANPKKLVSLIACDISTKQRKDIGHLTS